MTFLINDVSKYQGTIAWAAQAASHGTAIIRGHNGWVEDPTFRFNRAQAQAHAIRALGIYQYVTSGKDVVAQANQFCATVGSLNKNEFVMADLEDANVNGGLASALHVWCSVVEAKLGGKALIYTGDYLADALPPSVTGGRLRMLAAYRSAPPDHPYDIWQYTDSASAPGVSGGCDQSKTDLTAAQILARTHGGKNEAGQIPAVPLTAHFGNYDPSTFGWTVFPAADIVPLVYNGITFPQGVHRIALPWFTRVLDALTSRGLVPKPYNPGCWGAENRDVTGGTTKSFHAYAIAIDINAPDNPFVASGGFAPHTIQDGTAAVVRALGGEWGGGWQSPKDYMHIECHLSPADIGRVARPIPAPEAPDMTHDEMVAILRGEHVSFPTNGRPIVLFCKENGKYTRPAALWNGFNHQVLSSPQWTAVQGLVDLRKVSEAKYDALIPPKPVVVPPAAA